MRKKLTLAMVALILLVFPLGMWMIVTRCFDLSMERERTRALSEEAAIARAVSLEIGAQGASADENLYACAQTAQERYGSGTLRMVFVYQGVPIAGARLPEANGMKALLATQGRATLLDGPSQTLFIAHKLSDGLTLLLCSDVSPVYALRSQLALWGVILCAVGIALCAALAHVLSGMLVRPVRQLAQAAAALSEGAYDTPLPRAGRDETGMLTRAFAAMTQAVAQREGELREQSRRRQELIDALAHEMRTPLTAIVGGCRLLQRTALDPRRQQALLETMAQESLRLSEMDERLLLLTRMEHETPEFTEFSAMEMAREALSVFEGVVLEGEEARFTAERELTIMLLRNLVVNAQRAGGEMPVRVAVYDGGFSVTDSGCGMTPEQIDRAFDPFYKADKSRARQAGGAGLGLTLCRKIAALHGGKLHIDSEPGKGTKIVYRFDTTA